MKHPSHQIMGSLGDIYWGHVWDLASFRDCSNSCPAWGSCTAAFVDENLCLHDCPEAASLLFTVNDHLLKCAKFNFYRQVPGLWIQVGHRIRRYENFPQVVPELLESSISNEITVFTVMRHENINMDFIKIIEFSSKLQKKPVRWLRGTRSVSVWRKVTRPPR